MSDCTHGGRDVPLKPRTLESLEDMRSSLVGYQAVTGEDMGAFLLHADAIEAEVDSRYMLLPVDADGVPIHVGDVMEYENPNDEDKPFTVLGVDNDGDVFHCLEDRRLVPTCISVANCLLHVKPRTVEDVLRDCCNEWNEHLGDDWESGVYAKYADEIRELLGGDGE